MFIPLLRQHYESILLSISGISNKLKSSSLLQAYATFSAMLSMEAKLSDAYSDVRKEYADYQYALLPIATQHSSKLQKNQLESFTNISLEDFLTYVTPDVVCDPPALMEHYREYSADHELDQVQLIHQIIAIRLNSYQIIASKGSISRESVPPNVGNGLRSQVRQNTADSSFSVIYHHSKKDQKHPLGYS